MTVTLETWKNKDDSKIIAMISQDKYCNTYNVAIGWTEDNLFYVTFRRGNYWSIKSARQAIKRRGNFERITEV